MGSTIVVDYKTNSGKIVYAKGILKSIDNDSQMLIVEGKDGTIWMISKDSISSLKIGGDDP